MIFITQFFKSNIIIHSLRVSSLPKILGAPVTALTVLKTIMSV